MRTAKLCCGPLCAPLNRIKHTLDPKTSRMNWLEDFGGPDVGNHCSILKTLAKCHLSQNVNHFLREIFLRQLSPFAQQFIDQAFFAVLDREMRKGKWVPPGVNFTKLFRQAKSCPRTTWGKKFEVQFHQQSSKAKIKSKFAKLCIPFAKKGKSQFCRHVKSKKLPPIHFCTN